MRLFHALNILLATDDDDDGDTSDDYLVFFCFSF